MAANNPSNVEAAFEMLLEEIEISEKEIVKILSQAAENREYVKAKENLDQAESIGEFHEKVADMRREWVSHFADATSEDIPDASNHQGVSGRLGRGLRTPEEAYFRPILEAVIEMGGSVPLQEVLDSVHSKMQGTLKEVDLQPLTSDPQLPRWRNTAQWARSTMVKRGLLRDDSPRGIWEVSDAGRCFLANGGEG